MARTSPPTVSLADRLAAATAERKPGPKCIIGDYLDSLPADQRDDLLGALRSRRVSGVVAAEYLQSVGVDVTDSMVGHHRRNRCEGCRRKGWFA